MSAYMIAELTVTDAPAFERYRAQVPALIERHGGRYIVRGGLAEPLEGAAEPGRMVVLEFPTREAFHAFYSDPDYQPLLALRLASTTGRLVLVDGV